VTIIAAARAKKPSVRNPLQSEAKNLAEMLDFQTCILGVRKV
jgi:hypothetical protein